MSRGRGRGSSKGISNLEVLGIKPGEGIPPPILHPPPLFPPLERKPLELKNNETTQYLLCIKQEFNHLMRQSPFYLKPVVQNGKNIVKYSDRYRSSTSNDLTELLDNIPNWKNVMPKELHFAKRKKAKPKLKLKPTISGTKQPLSDKDLPRAEIGDRLKQLEEREEVLAESEEEEGGVKTEDEYYDEEVEEEEGDYQQTYFDPGDDFGGDEDETLEDGPSY